MSHVLITGASRGIGDAVRAKFEDNGWNVSYFYRNNVGDPRTSYAIKCDVSNPDAVHEGVASAVKRFGDIDVLVSNSGISRTGLVTDFEFDDYRAIFDTNFGGLFNTVNNVVPMMIHNKSGSIVAISSMWGQTGASCEALYSASKGAVDSYIKSLAKELGPSGIRVNCVSPGCVYTDMIKQYGPEDLEDLKNETPLGRIGEPEDIANTVYYLSTDQSSFITGQIIGVNGGFLI